MYMNQEHDKHNTSDMDEQDKARGQQQGQQNQGEKDQSKDTQNKSDSDQRGGQN